MLHPSKTFRWLIGYAPVVLLLLISACTNKAQIDDCSHRPAGCPINNWTDPDLMPPVLVEYFDSVHYVNSIDIMNTKLPNNQTVYNYLRSNDADFWNDWQANHGYTDGKFDINTFIARTTFIASRLADRTNFQFANEGANRPAQNGLAYVYHSSDYTGRHTAVSSGDANATCSEELHGMDAAGLFKFICDRNTVNVPARIDSQTVNWIGYAFHSTFNNFDDRQDIADLGQLPRAAIKPGDIIYWNFSNSATPGMIGVVLKNENEQLLAFLSSGAAYGTCDLNYSATSTSLATRGPRVVKLFGRDDANPDHELPLLGGDFNFFRWRPTFSFADLAMVVRYGVIRLKP